jgi:hypothetical protein
MPLQNNSSVQWAPNPCTHTHHEWRGKRSTLGMKLHRSEGGGEASPGPGSRVGGAAAGDAGSRHRASTSTTGRGADARHRASSPNTRTTATTHPSADVLAGLRVRDTGGGANGRGGHRHRGPAPNHRGTTGVAHTQQPPCIRCTHAHLGGSGSCTVWKGGGRLCNTHMNTHEDTAQLHDSK